MAKVLVVEDIEEFRALYVSIAKKHVGTGEVLEVSGPGEALRLIERTAFDVVVLDLRLNKSEDGVAVLHAAIAKDQLTQVIVISAYGTPELGRKIMEDGAFDIIHRNMGQGDPWDMLGHKIRLALRFREALQSATS